jgi:hypothetical protein
VATTGIVLLTVTLISLPGALMQWLTRLPGNVRFMQVERQYLWERHVTLKAFWRLLLQGNEIGDAALLTRLATLTSIAAVAIVLLAGLIRVRRQIARSGYCDGQRDRLIAATTLAMPLLMPFYFDYDLLLLAVPAVLTAAQWPARASASDRRMLWSWAALYAWLFVNPGVAEWTRVNGTVILLSTVAGLAMKALWQRGIVETNVREIRPSVAIAAAA